MSTLSIQDRLQQAAPLFSVEFFPPKSDESAGPLLRTAERLKAFSPDFASITYGAGGSTRSRTLKYAQKLNDDFGYAMMPHLTCVGHSKDELRGIIQEFKEAGLKQIMALRGDPPKGETNFTPHPDGLSYANELVHLIREEYPECAIGVAGYPEKHPEAPSMEIDLLNLKRKVDAGATFVTTQLFFDNAVYFKFVDDCKRAGIHIPILPGLLSVTSYAQAKRFCEMCDATLPADLEAQLVAAQDDKAAIEAIGIEWIANQAKELLEKGAPGIHLYVLNRAAPTIALMDKLQAAGFYKA
ncbi:methylenetetrahydrofolate reductase [NAD(P)H] [Coraliomargarita akajimensis]|uniref:Methylenetetrahydrofolate reductase n=1 Tax=Coraliomargarita akajimensis (strain DSM 45221 / IAM 15411 / JCM 23193 / KCTC 12865 / 04OKA010-24) TaxID=583355 RepID=D5EJ13_CORAD|nr:methylenetetrahydrofolate reductase [NAD(P)H] [Coraliomargarita akajimensis]ADE54412.1 5,10-methylenetetrahydrofolate reductase [Coraliomargarita akajimensis DSM 45221]